MRLMLEYPNIPSCAVCQKYMVDYDHREGTGSGRPNFWGPPDNRQPQLRPSVCPPPCQQKPTPGYCPKGSPEHEKEFILSDANWRTLEFYRAAKATHGRSLSDAAAQDEMVQQNFAALDRIFERHEQDQLTVAIGTAVARTVAGLFSKR